MVFQLHRHSTLPRHMAPRQMYDLGYSWNFMEQSAASHKHLCDEYLPGSSRQTIARVEPSLSATGAGSRRSSPSFSRRLMNWMN